MTLLQKRLEALRRQRETSVGTMEAVFNKAAEEDRSFDADEQKAFDDAKALVASLDQQINNLNALAHATLGGGAQNVGISTGTKGLETDLNADTRSAMDGGTGALEIGASPRITVHRTLPKGTAFTRYAMALACSKGNTMAAVEIAKQRWGNSTPEVETILRAAVAAGTTTDANWAKPLVPYQDMQSEMIELLRPMTITGRISGFRAVPFNVRMPRQTAGAVVGWVGETKPKGVTKLAFDTVTLPHSKIAAIIAISDELARMSTPSAEATVRQDLLDAISQFMDVQFVDPTVAAVADVSPGAVTNGATAVAATGGSVAQVTADLNAALTAMATANIPMRSPYWLMHTRTFNYLLTLRTTQDIYAFRDELARGMLLGIPVIKSNNVPLRDQNAGGGTEGYIVLMDAAEIFMADDGETMLDVSREASLQMDSAPNDGAQSLVSLWQNNLIGIRAERYVHWQRRRDAAVYVVNVVAY